MKTSTNLSYSQAVQLLRYEPATGLLFWRPRPSDLFPNQNAADSWNARYAGKEAFTHRDKDGYKVGTLMGRSYKAHRVAWLISNGVWPWKVDHIDGDRSNNRLANLRDVPWAQNCRNRSMGATNTSGIVGVRWDTQTSKWQAYIKVDGKLIHLGKFDDKSSAIEARMKAVKAYGFSERHGQRAA